MNFSEHAGLSQVESLFIFIIILSNIYRSMIPKNIFYIKPLRLVVPCSLPVRNIVFCINASFSTLLIKSMDVCVFFYIIYFIYR